MNAPTLFTPTLVKHFTMQNHPVSVECERGHGADEPDPLTLKCPECSLGFVASQVILLMATHNIRQIVVDGCEINFSHVTSKR
jgi:Zn finger protein HypA/HybF involved in hydrogenase expression